MHARANDRRGGRWAWLLALAGSACGGSGPGPQQPDAAAVADAASFDALPMTTDVSGILQGMPYHLRYASVKRAVPGDPRNWLCVSDVALTVDQCNQTGGPDRTMFLGPFVYDQSGAPVWGIAQDGLFRVGTGPASQLAQSGTITVWVDDPVSGALDLTMSVQFDEAPAAGNVVIP